VIPVAPPILTRVFQEISRGLVNLNNVKKIRDFPFPFPYAQMITMMLMMHWVITPVASCLIVDNIVWAAVLTFITVFAFWAINYIAEEIEMPFGDDANDLPIADMMRD
jgi:putative membrane protein